MKVTKIIDREFKKGISPKNGKPWTMVKIEVEGGKEATGFGHVVEGDEVDLTYNEQYKNYSFKLLEQGEIPSKDINQDLMDAPKNATQDRREYQVTRNMVWKNLLSHAGMPSTQAELNAFMKVVDMHTTALMGPVHEKKSGYEQAKETAAKFKPSEVEDVTDNYDPNELNNMFPEEE